MHTFSENLRFAASWTYGFFFILLAILFLISCFIALDNKKSKYIPWLLFAAVNCVMIGLMILRDKFNL